MKLPEYVSEPPPVPKEVLLPLKTVQTVLDKGTSVVFTKILELVVVNPPSPWSYPGGLWLLLLVSLICVSGSAAILQYALYYWLGARQLRRASAYSLTRFPRVSILVPVRNEPLEVLDRLLRSLASQSYSPESIEVVVVSDDEPQHFEELKKLCSSHRSRGLKVVAVRRGSSKGYKAGALNYGLKLCRGEYVAVFDADSVPEEAFLKKAIAFLEHNPWCDAVTSRWVSLNQSESPVAEAQGFTMGFVTRVFFDARAKLGLPTILLGSGSVYRRSFLEDASGWGEDVLAEDVDLTLRAMLSERRTAFLGDLEVAVEVPPTYLAFRRQQSRWIYGLAQLLKKYFVEVLRSRCPLSWKVDMLFYISQEAFLTVNALLAVVSLASLFLGIDLMIATAYPAPLFFAAAAAYVAAYLHYARSAGWGLRRGVVNLGRTTALVVSLLPTSVVQMAKGLLGIPHHWSVTPKGARARESGGWALGETLIGVVGMSLGVLALELSLISSATFMMALSLAFIYVGARTFEKKW